MRIRFRILIGIKTMPILKTRLMHGKKTAGSYPPVPVDGEVRGGVWQGLQVGGGAPPVLPGVQSGHAHSNLTQGSCHFITDTEISITPLLYPDTSK